jgi:hypothetical protein
VLAACGDSAWLTESPAGAPISSTHAQANDFAKANLAALNAGAYIVNGTAELFFLHCAQSLTVMFRA